MPHADGSPPGRPAPREPRPRGRSSGAAPAPGLATWFTVAVIVGAAFFLLGLLGQLFLKFVLPQMSGGEDPLQGVPWFVFALEAAFFVLCSAVALARLRRVEHVVPISLAGAILLLPICPWTIVSLIWLFTAYRREAQWSPERDLEARPETPSDAGPGVARPDRGS